MSVITSFYMDLLDHRVTITLNFVLSGVLTLAVTIYIGYDWLPLTLFITRGTAYIAANFTWLIT